MQMDAQQLVNEVNRKLNGEFENVVFDSDDWNTIVSVLNENIDRYNRIARWRSSYVPRYVVGTVGDAEFYRLKTAEIASISGSDRAHVLFYDTNDVLVGKYKLVDQDIFDDSELQSGMVTINSQGLQLKPVSSDDRIYGASIVLPVFKNVKRISLLTDNVKVDDIYWLITKSAADLSSTSPVAFIARNYDDLKQEADNRLKDMKKSNRTSQAAVPAFGGWNPLSGFQR